MTCEACKKRWYCITACPEINSELLDTYEELSAIENKINPSRYTGRLFFQQSGATR